MQKMCAESYKSTYNTFMEICEVVKKNRSFSSQVETPTLSPNAHDRKRQFIKANL